MFSSMIVTDDAEYKVVGRHSVILFAIKTQCDHFKVPSVVFSKHGFRYEVVGISFYGKVSKCF